MRSDISRLLLPDWPQINSILALYCPIPLTLYDKWAAQYGQTQLSASRAFPIVLLQVQRVFSVSKISFFLLRSDLSMLFLLSFYGGIWSICCPMSGKVLGTLQGVSIGPLDTEHLLPLDGRNLSSWIMPAKMRTKNQVLQWTNFQCVFLF